MSDRDRDEEEAVQKARSLWQEQEVEPIEVSLEAVKRRAAKFQRQIRFRNAREYAAGAVVAAIFGRQMIQAGTPGPVRAACALIVAGTAVVLVQIRRRGAASDVPAPLGAATIEHLRHHRAELERQRDLLANVGRWYLGPLLPGVLAFFVAVTASRPIPPEDRLAIWAITAAMMLGAVGLFAGIFALNRRAAAALQKEIDALPKDPG